MSRHGTRLVDFSFGRARCIPAATCRFVMHDPIQRQCMASRLLSSCMNGVFLGNTLWFLIPPTSGNGCRPVKASPKKVLVSWWRDILHSCVVTPEISIESTAMATRLTSSKTFTLSTKVSVAIRWSWVSRHCI